MLAKPLPCGEPLPAALEVLHQALLAKRREGRPASAAVVVAIAEAVEHGRAVDAAALLRSASEGRFGALATAETAPSKTDEVETRPPPSTRDVRGPGGLADAGASSPQAEAVEHGPALAPTLPTPTPAAALLAPVGAELLPAAEEGNTGETTAPRVGTPAAAAASTPQHVLGDTTDDSISGLTPDESRALQRAAAGPARWRNAALVALVLLIAATVVAGIFWSESKRPDTASAGVKALPEASTSSAAAPAPETPASEEASPAAELQEREAEPASEPAAAAADAQQPPAEPAFAESPASPPAPARLRIESEPPGAAVKRGDETLCTTPCDREVEPTPGFVQLGVELTGYAPKEIEVALPPGADVRQRVRLERKPARRVRRAPRPRTKAPAPKKTEATPPSPAPTAKPAPKTIRDIRMEPEAGEPKPEKKKRSIRGIRMD